MLLGLILLILAPIFARQPRSYWEERLAVLEAQRAAEKRSLADLTALSRVSIVVVCAGAFSVATPAQIASWATDTSSGSAS